MTSGKQGRPKPRLILLCCKCLSKGHGLGTQLLYSPLTVSQCRVTTNTPSNWVSALRSEQLLRVTLRTLWCAQYYERQLVLQSVVGGR